MDSEGHNTELTYKEADQEFAEVLGKVEKELCFPWGRPIWEEILGIVHERSLNESLPLSSYKKRLADVESLLSDLTSVFSRARDIEKNARIIWIHQPEHRLIFPSKTSKHSEDASYFNQTFARGELFDCVGFYLARPWMRHKGMDWVFLDAVLFSETEYLRENVRSGLAMGTINWLYAFSGGNVLKMAWQTLLFKSAVWVIRYPVPIGVISTLAYFKYETAAIIFSGLYGVYLCVRLALFPSRFIQRRNEAKAQKKAEEIFKDLLTAYDLCQLPVISPRALKAYLDLSLEKEVPFPGIVIALVDQIVSYDPTLFVPFHFERN